MQEKFSELLDYTFWVLETEIQKIADYWNRRPCNLNHSQSKVGSRTYFDEVEAKKYFVEPHIPVFAGFPLWRGKKVLEIGCGIGTDAINFARAGSIYTGVDLSVTSLDLARRRFDVYGLEGRLIEYNVESLSKALHGERFDLVYSFGVLHHTPSIISALKEIRKLCKANSVLKFMVYARHSWKNAMISAGLDQPEAQSGCPLANAYSKEEIEILLKECSFQPSEIKQTHIFPYKIPEYLNHKYVRQDWFKAMPAEVFGALESQLGWHLLVTATPN